MLRKIFAVIFVLNSLFFSLTTWNEFIFTKTLRTFTDNATTFSNIIQENITATKSKEACTSLLLDSAINKANLDIKASTFADRILENNYAYLVALFLAEQIFLIWAFVKVEKYINPKS